jgi:hypothetical protein
MGLLHRLGKAALGHSMAQAVLDELTREDSGADFMGFLDVFFLLVLSVGKALVSPL